MFPAYLEGVFGQMRAMLPPAAYTGHVAQLKAQLERDGWALPGPRLNALAGVLPIDTAMAEASVVTDTEAAFVLGDTLLVATWNEGDDYLTTDMLALGGTELTTVWNADWLSAYGDGDPTDVPEVRPMIVTLRAPSGVPYVLPFDAAWSNPAGCINFASTLILKAHGFRPAVGTTRQTGPAPRAWKR